MAEKRYLMTPGPTPVPPQVLAAMALPIVHHRSPDFRPTYRQALDRLKDVYRTQTEVLLYTASGTAGLESVVANLTSPGDRVVAVSAGYFGERWADIARAYGCEVEHIAYEWGETPSADDVASRLAELGGANVVLVTQSETSTGRRVRRARVRRCGEGGRHAHCRRRDLEPRRASLRDGRVGARLGRVRLAEGADVSAGPDDGLRLRRGVEGARGRGRSALLPRLGAHARGAGDARRSIHAGRLDRHRAERGARH